MKKQNNSQAMVDSEYWRKKYEVMQNYYSVLIGKNVTKIEDTCKSLNDLGFSLGNFETNLHSTMGELIEIRQKSKDKKFKAKIDDVIETLSGLRETSSYKAQSIKEIVNSFRQTL